MYLLTLFVAALVFVYLLRVEGDESIGFGGEFHINDGVADAFQVVPKVVTLGVPNETTGITESKTLDLPEAVIRKIATLKNGGSFQVKAQLITATRVRAEEIRKARATKLYKIVVPIDTGTMEVTVPGIMTSAKVEDLAAEEITVLTMTIEVSGPEEAP